MRQHAPAATDHSHPVEDHDLGLSHDLPRLVQRHRAADGMGRRGLFTLFGGVGAAASIYPACYDGRWPHVHFEVHESLDAATSAGDELRTSQLAFPQHVCETVYAEDGYEDSVTHLATVSLSGDMVFGDGYPLQMAKMTGSVADGYVATLNVPV